MANSRILGIALIFGMSFSAMHQSTCYADVRTHEERKRDSYVLVQAQNIEITQINTAYFDIHSTTFAFDHLFVCTSNVPTIFVLPRVRYANPVNMLGTAPSKEVEARCNSPGTC